MLINISNHPLSEWSEKQINEATRLWGGVVDIVFPQIDATATNEEIIDLVSSNIERYIELIEQYPAPSAFHIMGEMVYCFNLIKALKERGYIVVASTSNRDVEIAGDSKIVYFSFEKFREY